MQGVSLSHNPSLERSKREKKPELLIPSLLNAQIIVARVAVIIKSAIAKIPVISNPREMVQKTNPAKFPINQSINPPHMKLKIDQSNSFTTIYQSTLFRLPLPANSMPSTISIICFWR